MPHSVSALTDRNTMTDDDPRSVSFTVAGNEPPEIDMQATYGVDITVDEFARQHLISYLGLPLQWDAENEGWFWNVTLADLHMVGRLVDDIEAMDFGDDIEWGEDDGSDKEPGVLAVFGFRAYKEDNFYSDDE